jgi:uncharacterized protein YbjT (DUF2867 family)
MTLSATAPLAIAGASGRLGTLLSRELAATGTPQRLLVRDAARAPRAADGTALAHAEVAIVDGYADAEAMTAALTGARSFFMVSGREGPDRLAAHYAAVDAAVRAGVERIVYLSVVGAAPDAVFTLVHDHAATEEYIRASGLGWTFLRDNFYHALLLELVGDNGVIQGPAGQGRAASVAHADVAASAAAVLREPDGARHDGATYELTGPQSLSLAEVADLLSTAAGREIRYVEETQEEAYASRAHLGAEPFEVEAWVTSYQAIGANIFANVSDSVERLTGRPAQSFADWLAANPEQWTRLRR